MHISILGSAFFSSALVASSVIGSAIATPMQAARSTDSSSTNTEPKPASNNADLVAKLLTAQTTVDRYKLLSNDDYAYDFNNPPSDAITKGMGGHTVKADRKAFPALVGTGVSMTLGFLDGCGFNTPHTHPRSAEFNVVVRGALNAQFIAENGAEIVHHNATVFQSIIFPKGAVHTEFNPNCESAVFVAGFADEDPGVQQSAQTFFGLDGDVVKMALGNEAISGLDVDKFRDVIPHNVHHGVSDCLKRCKGKIEKAS